VFKCSTPYGINDKNTAPPETRLATWLLDSFARIWRESSFHTPIVPETTRDRSPEAISSKGLRKCKDLQLTKNRYIGDGIRIVGDRKVDRANTLRDPCIFSQIFACGWL
jgi:hypothetical protein